MGKIFALDIGIKRTGVAETDHLQLIATGLPTVDTHLLLPFIEKYMQDEKPEALVIGEPKRLHGVPSELEIFIQLIIEQVVARFPSLPIHRVDERFTSKMAAHALSMSGMGKKKRQEKWRVDQISAVIILQSWMQTR